MTIRSKYMALLQLFFLLYTTIRPKLRVSLIYVFHLHTTIRQKYLVLFHLFCLCARPFDENSGSLLIFFLFAHDHSTKIYDPLSFVLSLWTTIRRKIRVLLNLVLLFAHDHSTKIRGHSYFSIYFFLSCANISFGIFMTVLPLYFVRSICGSAAFIFCPL